jgi:hypothetical protein
MLNLTDSAVQKCKEFLSQGNLLGHGVRIFAISGG